VSVEHFRRRADECRRLAIVARNASDKAFWSGLVERWKALEIRNAQQPARDKVTVTPSGDNLNWARPIDAALRVGARSPSRNE
jgi:hypothetical protein